MSENTAAIVRLVRDGQPIAVVALAQGDFGGGEPELSAAVAATAVFAEAALYRHDDVVECLWARGDEGIDEFDGDFPAGEDLPERWFQRCGADGCYVDGTDLDLDDSDNVRVSAGTDEGAYVSTWHWVQSKDAIREAEDGVVEIVSPAIGADETVDAVSESSDALHQAAEHVAQWWKGVIEDADAEEIVAVSGMLLAAFQAHPDADAALWDTGDQGHCVGARVRARAGDLFVMAGDGACHVFDASVLGATAAACYAAWMEAPDHWSDKALAARGRDDSGQVVDLFAPRTKAAPSGMRM